MKQILDSAFVQLLQHLHRGGNFAYWWAASEVKKLDAAGNETKEPAEKHTTWYPVGEPAPLPVAANGHGPRHLYFGVHPVVAIPTERTGKDGTYKPKQEKVRPKLQEIAAINCLFGEFDTTHPPSDAPLASDRLQTSPGKEHHYWRLRDPFILDTEEKRDYAKRVQHAWVLYVNSDPAAKDLARVLRIAGTRNVKAAYGPDYPTVVILESDPTRLYDLADLEALCNAYMAPSTAERARSVAQRGPLPYYDGEAQNETERIWRALERLAPWRYENYGAWIETGMALKEYGAEGLRQWKDWSMSGTTYDSAVCDSKWDTFSTEGRGLGSIFHWADEDDPGGKPQRPEAPPLLLRDGGAYCPVCANAVRKSRPEYGGGWFCSCQKPALTWPASAYTPTNSNSHTNYHATTTGETVVDGSRPPRFTVRTEEDLQLLPDPRWLLDGELLAAGFHLIYGASGSGKTFYSIDRALRYASLGGRCLYVATEDLSGLKMRVHAWRVAHPGATGRLAWLEMPEGIDLANAAQVDELLAAIDGQSFDLITVDTLRESFIGDENSSQDMATVNRAVQRIIRATGAAVDVIHHSGVNEGRERGSTALSANCDLKWKISTDDDRIVLSCEKFRHGPAFEPRYFRITAVEGTNSAIIRPASQTTSQNAPLTPAQRKVLETLSLSIFADIGAKTADLMKDAGMSNNGTLYRTLSTLKNRGYIEQGTKGDPYYLTPAGRAAIGPNYQPAPGSEAETVATTTAYTAPQRPTTTTTSQLPPTTTVDTTTTTTTPTTRKGGSGSSGEGREKRGDSNNLWEEVELADEAPEVPAVLAGLKVDYLLKKLAANDDVSIRSHLYMHERLSDYQEVIGALRVLQVAAAVIEDDGPIRPLSDDYEELF